MCMLLILRINIGQKYFYSVRVHLGGTFYVFAGTFGTYVKSF